MLADFWDDQQRGFYMTADDAEELLIRPREVYDGAVPSGNSVAMGTLLRLGRMTANDEWQQRARELAAGFAAEVRRYPAGHTLLLCQLDFDLGPSYEVVIAGDAGADDTTALLRALYKQYVPNKVVLFRPAGEDAPAIAQLSKFVANQRAIDGQATVYVCRQYECERPTHDPQQMLRSLGVKDSP